MFFFDGDESVTQTTGSGTKGDDNKASANPHDVNQLPDDIGERIGQGSDQDVEGQLL